MCVCVWEGGAHTWKLMIMMLLLMMMLASLHCTLTQAVACTPCGLFRTCRPPFTNKLWYLHHTPVHITHMNTNV